MLSIGGCDEVKYRFLGELNWLPGVTGLAFFCGKGRPGGVCALSLGLRRGLASRLPEFC